MNSPLIVDPDGPACKAECLLPTGSYKIRGVRAFFEGRQPAELRVLSAGNLALAAAHECRLRSVACRTLVPQGVSPLKKSKLELLGAEVEELPYDHIWRLVQEPPQDESFLHPFHPDLLRGYAGIAEELPDAALVVPFGLGGLAMALARSQLRIVLCEIEGHAPFERALQAGRPVEGPRLQSFIEALGTPCVLPEVFNRLKDRVEGSIVVSQGETEEALRYLHQRHQLRVEGAAAAALAAARKRPGSVALLTGGNISQEAFDRIVC